MHVSFVPRVAFTPSNSSQKGTEIKVCEDKRYDAIHCMLSDYFVGLVRESLKLLFSVPISFSFDSNLL